MGFAVARGAGFGLRFNANNATFIRIDVGFSHEGFQVWFKFNDAFNSRRFHGFTGNEPNENSTPACVRVSSGIGWRDINCNNNYDALCERD